MSNEAFAYQLRAAWQKESEKSPFSEVQQFRALMRSFSSLKKDFALEEFHGTKHQVIFNGIGSWGRVPARCEISDLLIVSYKRNPTFKARLTLLQVKKSDEKHNNLCRKWPDKSHTTRFKANLEQWDLLSRRPYVLPQPPFECAPDILKGAILPSIGSLGVFHKINRNKYDFFYISADIAEPIGSPKRKFAKLQIKEVDGLREIHGYQERVFTCCMLTFGQSLYNLEIGTPIESHGCVNGKDQKYREMLRGWLRGVLMSHAEMTMRDSRLIPELMEFLPSEDESPFMHEPPALLMIRIEQ
jgi:hypothetical protein